MADDTPADEFIRLDDLLTLIENLQDALCKVEWVRHHDGSFRCAFCHGRTEEEGGDGHEPGCDWSRLTAALTAETLATMSTTVPEPGDRTVGVDQPVMARIASWEETAPTWSQLNQGVARSLVAQGEWSGLPVPIGGIALALESRSPHVEKVRELQAAVDAEERRRVARERKRLKALGQLGELDEDDDEDDEEGAHWLTVNEWWSSRLRQHVWIARHETTGELRWGLEPRDYVRKTKLLFDTLRCAFIWPMEAEQKALATLATLVKPHIFDSYVLTGTFLETSPRSGLVYIFRRLRPTIVINPRRYRVLCALCLHPMAFYEQTHAGAMVPTDDVIAHLLLMRGDEALFWKRANQHSCDYPEAGL